MQRFFDVLFSGLAVLVLSPMLLPIMALLRLTGEGHVFYVQERIGKGGKPFGLLKFATMLRDSPNIGTGEITVKNDPRVLPVGRFLRKTKINELPQLWNIVAGDLSIVGPRPMVATTYADYPPNAREILNTVRPGLSGVGSIVFRDEESFLAGKPDPKAFYRESIIPYKADLERWYVAHQGLRVYFEVIFLTAWAIVFKHTTLPWRVWPTLPPLPADLAGANTVPA